MTPRRLRRSAEATTEQVGPPLGRSRNGQVGGSPTTDLTLERGLQQRALVCELIIDDLYGPQRLLAGGHLPTRAVVAAAAYLRSCVGIASPGSHRLTMYAAELGRAEDGSLAVAADRTEAPCNLGLATALESSRAAGDAGPPPLDPGATDTNAFARADEWAATVRWALDDLAGPGDEPPTVLIMVDDASGKVPSLGVEHARPQLLTVESAALWLMSRPPDGDRRRVDVLVRMTPSTGCDPLEAGRGSGVGTSNNGVVGLVESSRRGSVAVANPLGSGVGECLAILPSFARLARTLTGEDLQVPSLPTWWCGDASSLSHVLAYLDRLVVRPSVDRLHGSKSIDGRLLSLEQRELLAARISAAPHRFVGQAPSSSVVPTRGDQKVRAFLTWGREGYRCLDHGVTVDDAVAVALSGLLTTGRAGERKMASPGPRVL